MKKLLKSAAAGLLTLSTVFMFTSHSAYAASTNDNTLKFKNKSNISITNKDLKRLENLGFSEDDIYNMDPDEYNLNKNLNGTVVSSNSKYYEVTENPDGTTSVNELDKTNYDNKVAKKKQANAQAEAQALTTGGITPMANPSTGSTSYKTMTTQIISLGSRQFRLKNSVTWSTMPTTRSYDVIGVAFNSSQYVGNKGTEYAKQNWTSYSYDTGASTAGSASYAAGSSYWNYAPEGYGTKMNLPDDTDSVTRIGTMTGNRIKALSSYAYFTVEELKYGTQSRIDAYGRYAHADTTVSYNYSFSVTLTGIGISFSSTSATNFDIQNNTQATLYF